jgi:propionate CoA-transferase
MLMKVIKSSEICSLIKDGDMVFYPGITLGGFAEESVIEIEKSFLATGHPRDLTVYWQSGVGNRGDRGFAHMAYEGLLKRGVGGHLKGCGPAVERLAGENKAEIYNFPQGVMATMPRYIAAKKPGVITKVGLGTMMDPRQGGGAMNQKARDAEDLVEIIEIHGEEWLLYKLPKIDVAIIRGTYADEKGNISIKKEGYQLGQLALAEAAKACGGIVICQVEKIISAGAIPPKEVKVPGIMVDYVYVAKPEYHWQTAQTVYNPVFAGEYKVPLDSIPLEKLSPRKVIARRAAMELSPYTVVNLGVGIPEAVSSVATEENVLHLFTLTTEAGGIGGVPANKHDFGCCWNADATLEMADQFDFYDGGGLDFGCLGALQVDERGNVNSSMLNGGGIGVGGFMNVAGGSKKIVFTTIFCGGMEGKLGEGKLVITREGDIKKFTNSLEQISFNGELAVKDKKEVMFVTERAVFELTEDGIELKEVAPGISIEEDILDQMDFMPIIKDVKLMPAGIFNEKWGGLAEVMERKMKG